VQKAHHQHHAHVNELSACDSIFST
jgi:hypothetical protein